MTDKQEKKLHGTYVEFDAVDTLLAACRRVRDAGYVKTDAYTPFPVHGIDKALGIKPTGLPWIVLACGLVGTSIGLVMQVWMNTIDYPYIISGKPFFSMPAFIPVSFELTILLASFGAFFGMLALNGLPKFSNPIFTDSRFDRATDDKFFLYIDAADPRFNHAGVSRLLTDIGGTHLQDVYDDGSPTEVPKAFFWILGTVIFLSMIPLLLVARMRVTTSGSPRFHVFYDMDFSPAKDAQMISTLFADGRAMRPDVPGTVAVGQFDEELDFYTGINMEVLARTDHARSTRLVRALLYPSGPQDPVGDEPVVEPPAVGVPAEEVPAEQPPAEEVPAEQPPAEEVPAEQPPAEEVPAEQPPAEEVPAEESPAEEAATQEEAVDEETPMDESAVEEPAVEEPAVEEPLAEEQPLEEMADSVDSDEGDSAAQAGSAAVAPPAASVEDSTPWLKENPLPLSLAVLERGRTQFDIYCATCHGGDGRGNGLVNRRAQRILATAWVQPSSLHQETLTSEAYPDGKLFSTISNGIRKMPGYSSQINVHDRWAIVAYVRALQASQNAEIDDLPVDKRNELKKLKSDVEKRLADQAEADRLKAEEAAQKRAVSTVKPST
jgi:mono/diheme cytochrome c family protein